MQRTYLTRRRNQLFEVVNRGSHLPLAGRLFTDEDARPTFYVARPSIAPIIAKVTILLKKLALDSHSFLQICSKHPFCHRRTS